MYFSNDSLAQLKLALYNEPLYLACETVGLAADRCEAGTETEQERADFWPTRLRLAVK